MTPRGVTPPVDASWVKWHVERDREVRAEVLADFEELAARWALAGYDAQSVVLSSVVDKWRTK